MTSPAPDTGRTAEEMRAEIIAALNAAFRGFSFPGGRWSTGYGAEMAVDALLSGPLAPILQEAATLRDQLRESAMQHIARDLEDEEAATEIAQLRSRLLQAEQGGEAMRKALKPFAALTFSFDGFSCDPTTLVFQHREYGQWRSDHHCAFDAMITAARAALNPNQEAGDGA